MPEKRLARAREGYAGYVFQPPTPVTYAAAVQERICTMLRAHDEDIKRALGIPADHWPTGDGATS